MKTKLTKLILVLALCIDLPLFAGSNTGYNPNIYYRIQNKATGRYLDNMGNTANGSYECQYSGSTSYNQQWQIIAYDAGYYRIIARTGGLAVDNYGSTSDGANIQSYALGTSQNQQWQIVNQGNGYFKIINRTSGKCLDTGGLNSDGAILQQWSSGYSDNQLWAIAAYTTSGNNNPAIWGEYGDPTLKCFNGKYYLYPTTDGYPGWNSTFFKCFTSSDLVNWTDNGIVLDLANVGWTTHNYAWAPEVVQKGSTYYMYYCANSSIGVATSSSPSGPFTDALGHALITQQQYIGANTIDPCCFIDDDGQAYLYYGNSRCGVVKLNSDMMSLNGTPTDITPSGFLEATYVVKRNGIYYLFYSVYGTTSPDYQVWVATSTSPMGPFSNQSSNPVLSRSGNIVCTGSCGIMQVPGRDEWYIAYHRFTIPGGDGMHREVCIDRLYFNTDGTVKAVTPTLAGITSPVIPGSTPVANGTYKLIARHSGKAMDAYGAQTANGTRIIQWTYGSGANQKWTVTDTGSGYYKIIGVQSGRSLDIDYSSGGTANGTKVQLWDYWNGPSQQFNFTATDSGYYRITPNCATGSCLDVNGASTADGANVQLWQWLNGSNQQWSPQAP